MHILCLGLNHRTANISLRERLAFTEESVRAACSRLGCGNQEPAGSIAEMVILSTCNRVEIYTVQENLDFELIESFLEEARGVSRSEFIPSTYHLADQETVDHLLRVTAGLDSLILGEPQILGQVMQAFELARSQDSTGPLFSHLFQIALQAGKRVRTETSIGHNPASVSTVAARLAEQVLSGGSRNGNRPLETSQVVVVGAGEMAELAVEALRKRGAEQILVVNRTLERARQLAERWHGEAATFENLAYSISRADVLVTSTGATHTIISTEMVANSRNGKDLVIIDIAVPRDVDPQVADLPGVHLYDIDTLHQGLEDSLNRRLQEVPRVEAILEEEKAEFNHYLAALDIYPLIAELHQRVESIRQEELEKTLRRLPCLDEADRMRLNLMTQALVNKILHAPISHLRDSAGRPEAAERAAAARLLFDLDTINQTS